MKTKIDEKAERVKKNINGIAEKSKETIREIIDSNNKFAQNAVESSSKMFENIEKNFKNKGMDDHVSDTLKHSIMKSVKMAEDTLDAIINSYTRQMALTVDFNSKLVDAVKESNPENADKFLELIHENFEATYKLAQENTQEILDFYNKHTNLTLNFNKKFSDVINGEIDILFNAQNKSLRKFTDWASEWWKQSADMEKPRDKF